LNPASLREIAQKNPNAEIYDRLTGEFESWHERKAGGFSPH
jgi:hypothetical protein